MPIAKSLPILSFALCSTAFGQIPFIYPGGIVNAASGVNSDPGHFGFVPGSLATIYGSNLAQGTQAATTTPLSTSLLGTRVLVANIAAPLLYVSPTQINFQVPNDTLYLLSEADFKPLPLVVRTTGAASDPVNIEVADTGAGIFTSNGAGCGPGAIQNISASGQVTLNSPSNSATPEQFITFYGTGFGLTPSIQTDGVPAPSMPPTPLLIGAAGNFDGTGGYTTFSGLAPRLIGVDQVNTQIVDSDREGCAVPLTVGTSQPVTVSIHRGGGVCVDPPPAAEGIVLLQRTTIVGTANDGTVETLDATFVQSPGRKATPIQLPLQNYNYETDLLSPSCPVPGYLYLSAGSLSLKTPSSTLSGLTAAPGSSYAVTLPPNPLRPGNYHVTLPSGTLQPANFTLAPDTPGTVGPFQINLAFGKDIQILTPPPAVGSTLSSGDKITVSWSGGDPDSLVSVSLISHYPQRHFRSTCQALASVGQCTLAYVVYNGVTSIANPRTSHGELIYQIDPPPPSITTFSAPGLSLGGQAIWRIVHSFQGFAIE